jgi:hypothetical protein
MANGLFTLKQQLQGLIQKAWSGTQKTNYVEYLVVAGGGSGSSNSQWNAGAGGGGGGGGLVQGILPIAVGSSITVTIGAGGTGVSSTNSYSNGNTGVSSVFGSITAIGGGGGASNNLAGVSGGSGGGAGTGTSTIGQGTFGQGNAGGLGAATSSGGGGGAGTVGLSGTTTVSANGGAGIASAISGTVTTYAGGGGGGGSSSASAGSAGVGGATAGGLGWNNGGSTGGLANSSNATANTGGGSGGSGSGSTNTVSSGNGGSGIVIISYPDTYSAPASFGGANSPTASTSGSGSLSFNGSSQWLSYGSASNFTFLNNGSTFTVEAWVYPTATLTGTNTLIATGYNSASIGLNIWFGNATNNDVYVVFYNSGTYSSFYTSTNAITINAWNHIAVTYNSSGTTAAIYVNGVSQSLTFGGTSLSSFTFSSSAPSYPLKVASTQNGAYYFPGYMSNVRITNTLVYSSNFTPSTTPLKPVSGTQFLLSTVSPNGYLDSSTNGYIYTLTGTPSWNQASPFATGLGYKNRVYTWTGSGTVTF